MLRNLLWLTLLAVAGCGDNLSQVGKDKGGESIVERDNATYIQTTKTGMVNASFHPIRAVQVYEYNGHQYLRFLSNTGYAEQTPVHDPDCPKCNKKAQ